MKRLVVLGTPFLMIIVVLWIASNALPGERLYPIREQLRKVGLGEPSMSEVDELIADARVDVQEAQAAASSSDFENRYEALDPAVEAMVTLRAARDFIEDVPPPDKAIRYARIEGLERQATAVIAENRDRLIDSSGA
jgi:hypothetical protein